MHLPLIITEVDAVATSYLLRSISYLIAKPVMFNTRQEEELSWIMYTLLLTKDDWR